MPPTFEQVNSHCQDVHRTTLEVYDRIVTLIDKEHQNQGGGNNKENGAVSKSNQKRQQRRSVV